MLQIQQPTISRIGRARATCRTLTRRPPSAGQAEQVRQLDRTPIGAIPCRQSTAPAPIRSLPGISGLPAPRAGDAGRSSRQPGAEKDPGWSSQTCAPNLPESECDCTGNWRSSARSQPRRPREEGSEFFRTDSMAIRFPFTSNLTQALALQIENEFKDLKTSAFQMPNGHTSFAKSDVCSLCKTEVLRQYNPQ